MSKEVSNVVTPKNAAVIRFQLSLKKTKVVADVRTTSPTLIDDKWRKN